MEDHGNGIEGGPGHSDADAESEQTRELRREQALRESRERELAAQDPTEAGTQTHERRAEKAEYLREKLAERERAERRAADVDDG